MAYLSRRELDELKPTIDKTVYKILGSSDSSLVSTAVHCLSSGYDKRKTTDKLSSYVDSKKATKLAEKLFDLVEDVRYKSRKRGHDDSNREKDSKRSKSRYDDRERESDRNRDRDKEKSKLSNNEIKEMMQSAQKQIEERKKSLDSLGTKNSNVNVPIPTPSIYGIPMGLLNRGEADKARKIAQLQAQIQNRISTGILPNVIQIPVVPDKPTPLILDEEGRTVDKSGKAVQLTHIAPTLKANIRAQKREQFRTHHHDKGTEESSETKFFDNRIGTKPPMRNKRALRFHEPGKFQQLAERLRMKVNLNRNIYIYLQIIRKKKLVNQNNIILS